MNVADPARIGVAGPRPTWLDPVVWPFEPRDLETVDGRVAVTDVGHGAPIVLAHVGFWSFVWRDLLTSLEAERRCVTFDALGTGRSERVAPSATTLTTASRTVGAVLDALAEPCVLVVHDLGGAPALHAAATRADLVQGLVVVNSFGWRPSGFAFRAMLAVMGSAAMRESDAWTGWLPRASSTRLGVGRNLDRRERAAFRAGVDRSARRSFHRFMRSARSADDLFASVESALAGPLRDVPVRTVFGSRNDPLRFQPHWKRLFPRAEQVVVPGGNHFPMCDAPTVVARTITSLPVAVPGLHR